MSVAPLLDHSYTPVTYRGETAEVMTDIYQPDGNLVIWKRSLPTSLQQEIRPLLLASNRLQLSHTLTHNTAEQQLRNELTPYGDVDGLCHNIAELVDMFCCLFDLNEARLRLTQMDAAMCPRFHVDHVPCRLVTTFTGVGTEWLEGPGLDRSKLGRGNQGLPDHQSGLYSDMSCIKQASAGDVLLLKGERWEGNEGFGLIHRSPANVSGEQRLLMTLDFSH